MLYYQFYRFSKFMKSIGSTPFIKPHGDAIILLTAFELLNVSTIWLVLFDKTLTGNYNLDLVICTILIFILNASRYLFNQRYKKTIQKYEAKKEKLSINIISTLYVSTSILCFYFVHSEYFGDVFPLFP